MSGLNLHLEDGRPGVFWVYDALIDSKLRYYAKAVYVVLARQARTGKRLQYSHAEIAEMADISESSARRGLNDLAKAGWLKITKTVIPNSPLKGPNVYKLLAPPSVLAEQSSVQGEQVDRSGEAVDCSGRAITTEGKLKREELQHPEVKTPSLSPIDAGFEAFWEKYPRKTAKAVALKAWAKHIGSDPLTITMVMEAVRAQQAPSNTLAPLNGKTYIPHPASWLNGARWNDEIVAAPKVAGRFDMGDWAGRESA